jgi:hypothetical protein
MGCGDECPYVPGAKRDDWPIEDPKGNPIEKVRDIRDDIRERVRSLTELEGGPIGSVGRMRSSRERGINEGKGEGERNISLRTPEHDDEHPPRRHAQNQNAKRPAILKNAANPKPARLPHR